METVLIKGETYVMGNELPKRNRKHHQDEPKLKVTVRDFKIGKAKVTAAQFCQFMNSVDDQRKDERFSFYYAGLIGTYDYTSIVYQPGSDTFIPKTGREDSPANQVTWSGAAEFCNWLSAMTGRTYRLPTEAEWELAARRKGDELRGILDEWSGEWCINRWAPIPEADDMTDSDPYLNDLSSERAVRGQMKMKRPPLIPFPLSENGQHAPSPWTRQHQLPHDVKQAAWYGFRVVEEITEQEKSGSAAK